MFVLAKPQTRIAKRKEYGTFDFIVLPSTVIRHETGEVVETTSWMPFKTFDEAFAYLRDELNGDSRYFIFEWVGTEYGRITKE